MTWQTKRQSNQQRQDHLQNTPKEQAQWKDNVNENVSYKDIDIEDEEMRSEKLWLMSQLSLKSRQLCTLNHDNHIVGCQ